MNVGGHIFRQLDWSQSGKSLINPEKTSECLYRDCILGLNAFSSQHQASVGFREMLVRTAAGPRAESGDVDLLVMWSLT